jgi:hypothetical protein
VAEPMARYVENYAHGRLQILDCRFILDFGFESEI